MSEIREGIISGRSGGPRLTAEDLVPKGVVPYMITGDWEIVLKDGKMFIETTDYHPGTLVFTSGALKKIVEELERKEQ